MTKEERKIYNKQYRKNNQNSLKEYDKTYYSDNKESRKIYYEENKEKINQSSIKYLKDNPDKKKQHQDKWQSKNREYFRIYHINNKDRDNERIIKYQRLRYQNDKNFKLRVNIRTRIYSALKNNQKSGKTLDLLGCTIVFFKSHIESQFLPEMTWENHGKVWEIDHIKECCNFDLTTEVEQKKCFHYSNQRPLFKTTSIAESFGYKDHIGNRNRLK